jgi:hypothetical protein
VDPLVFFNEFFGKRLGLAFVDVRRLISAKQTVVKATTKSAIAAEPNSGIVLPPREAQ